MNWIRYNKYKKAKKQHSEYITDFYRKKLMKIINSKLISHKIINYDKNDDEIVESDDISHDMSDINRTVIMKFEINNEIFDISINQKYETIKKINNYDYETYRFYYTLKINDIVFYVGQEFLANLFVDTYNHEFNKKIKNIKISLNKI